jgi:hypothetical protein
MTLRPELFVFISGPFFPAVIIFRFVLLPLSTPEMGGRFRLKFCKYPGPVESGSIGTRPGEPFQPASEGPNYLIWAFVGSVSRYAIKSRISFASSPSSRPGGMSESLFALRETISALAS